MMSILIYRPNIGFSCHSLISLYCGRLNVLVSWAVTEPGRSRSELRCYFECRGAVLALILGAATSSLSGVGSPSSEIQFILPKKNTA
jgi:hypothetical protein